MEQDCLRIIRPGDTRWLSYDRSVAAIWRQYPAILQFLESQYIKGEVGGAIGGLLLVFREEQTILILSLLRTILPPLARLSKTLQTPEMSLQEALTRVQATIDFLDEIEFDEFKRNSTELIQECVEKGPNIIMMDNLKRKITKEKLETYFQSVLSNIRDRFSDSFQVLAQFQTSPNEE